MKITFVPLAELHFPLLLKWLEAIHVKAWWDKYVKWNIELIQQKYSDYVKGYKLENGIAKTINAYIICADNNSVGYIQAYNAYDFARSKPLEGLPEKLAAFDMFIGEEAYLKRGVGSSAITQFLKEYCNSYSHVFADPESSNVAAISTYEKAGLKRLEEQPNADEVWMIKELSTSDQLNQTAHILIANSKIADVLSDLKEREPIFHHPDKFGKTEQDIVNQMCDEFFEVGASGKRYSRDDVVKTLLERYSNPNYEDVWEIKDFQCLEISPDNYLLTYTLLQEERVTRRSTIWRRINDAWKILYHQGTVVEDLII